MPVGFCNEPLHCKQAVGVVFLHWQISKNFIELASIKQSPQTRWVEGSLGKSLAQTWSKMTAILHVLYVHAWIMWPESSILCWGAGCAKPFVLVLVTGLLQTSCCWSHWSHLLQTNSSDAHGFIPLPGFNPGGCWCASPSFRYRCLIQNGLTIHTPQQPGCI